MFAIFFGDPTFEKNLIFCAIRHHSKNLNFSYLINDLVPKRCVVSYANCYAHFLAKQNIF